MALNYQELLTAVPLIIKGNNVPNIVGEAGIGKSALVEDVANRNHAKLFTTVVSLTEQGDLSMPVPPLTSDSFIQTKDYGKLADVQFGYSHTLISIINYAQDNPNVPIYWFLDEFNRGSQAVQSELMNLVLQRTINSLKLPEQVHIIIAENPDSTMTGFKDTNYGVMSGDDAIKDRTVRLVMEANVDDWIKWAQTNDDVNSRQMIHPQVVRYIQGHPDLLHNKATDSDLYPTPRAWKRVSNDLYELEKLNFNQRKNIQLDIFAGDLGEQVATDFNEYVNQFQLSIIANDILKLPFNQIVEDFKEMSESQKTDILKQLIQLNPEVDDKFGNRFYHLLKLLSPDGKYAIVLYISNNSSLFEEIYNQITNSESLEKLYQLFEKIGLDSL